MLEINSDQLRVWLERHLDELSPVQADVARLRFGAGGGTTLSAEEVRQRLGLSDSELRAEEAEILRFMRITNRES